MSDKNILNQNLINFILEAPDKTLATSGPAGINVVPVSTIRVVDDKILLVNYFMDKTITNIKSNPQVSLVCWSGLDGHQIKGSIEYQTSGKLFDDITSWAATEFPARTVHGILLLTAEEVYPISARA